MQNIHFSQWLTSERVSGNYNFTVSLPVVFSTINFGGQISIINNTTDNHGFTLIGTSSVIFRTGEITIVKCLFYGY